MPDIYSANLTRTPQFGAYLNQYSATSGRVPSARILDQIIQSELDNASNQMWRNKQLQFQQQELAERSRQFDVSKEMTEKGQRSGEVQGVLGLGTYLLGQKLQSDRLREILGGGATQTAISKPTVAGPSLWGKAKDVLGFGGTATTPTAGPSVTGGFTPEELALDTSGASFTGGAGPTATGFNAWDYAVPGLAGLATGALVGQSGTGRDVGQFLMAQHGGESEHGAVSGGIAGGLTGYLLSGGNLWGALAGGALGAVGGSDLKESIFGD